MKQCKAEEPNQKSIIMIVDFIIAQRINFGLTQKALAQKAGISKRSLERIEGEKGRVSAPSLVTIIQICEALELSLICARK